MNKSQNVPLKYKKDARNKDKKHSNTYFFNACKHLDCENMISWIVLVVANRLIFDLDTSHRGIVRSQELHGVFYLKFSEN